MESKLLLFIRGGIAIEAYSSSNEITWKENIYSYPCIRASNTAIRLCDTSGILNVLLCKESTDGKQIFTFNPWRHRYESMFKSELRLHGKKISISYPCIRAPNTAMRLCDTSGILNVLLCTESTVGSKLLLFIRGGIPASKYLHALYLDHAKINICAEFFTNGSMPTMQRHSTKATCHPSINLLKRLSNSLHLHRFGSRFNTRD